MRGIHIIEDVLPDPVGYRERMLRSSFETMNFGEAGVFHGIARSDELGTVLPALITQRLPQLISKLTFLRKSPYGQVEPNFIHTDSGMGDWTGILYLNEKPAAGDGTDFWRHWDTGFVEPNGGDEKTADWKDSAKWNRWHHVEAKFNRLLLFKAPLFHSRAIFENYGSGDDARLIQVVFGTGNLYS